jgi:Uma2 family endonuclease
MFVVQALEPVRWGGKLLPGQDELPCEDGEPVETGFHDAQNALLKDTLMEAWTERRDFFVAGNMFVYFSERQVRSNDFRGPDVFVVLDVEAKGRKSWVAWEEGGRLPDVVIEVTSPSTEATDRGEKMRVYAQVWRTSAYFIFDPETERLDGFRLDNAERRYISIEPDGSGDLEVAVLGLKLGLRSTYYRQYQRRFLRWLSAEGIQLPTAQERAREAEERAREAEERAEAERARADSLAARLSESEDD